jgi:simple sugar transport system ATP-binding protein
VKARRLGIETVYQDLALFDNLDAVSNFYAGREPANPSWLHSFGWVNDRAMSKETDELLERLQVNVQKNMEIGLMSGGQRQAVACARAMAFGQSIVILDEPTSALSVKESAKVLYYIESARERGLSVIFITHNVHQVYPVADRFTILSLGRSVADFRRGEVSQEQISDMIVHGHELRAELRRKEREA